MGRAWGWLGCGRWGGGGATGAGGGGGGGALGVGVLRASGLGLGGNYPVGLTRGREWGARAGGQRAANIL